MPIRTARPKPNPARTIPLREYAARRDRLLKALGDSAGVVFAGNAGGHLTEKWRPDLHFLYLTGIQTEAGAAVLFDPSHPNPKRRIVLFLRPLNPEADRWEGYRDEIGSHLRSATGFATVMRTGMLPAMLAAAARRTKKLAALHPVSAHTEEVGPDLAVFRKVCERVPGCGIEDRTMLLNTMRASKSAAEVGLMKRAAEATAAGYAAAVRMIRPGVGEAEVQRAIESAYLEAGAEGTAYRSIVGSGLNATVLHYERNNGVCREGDLLLIDSGAQFAGYACDVTRTYPVGGRFTAEQKKVYQTVLDAQAAAIRTARAGRFMWEVDEAARGVIEKAGFGDHFPHGTGHQLGLHVHDADPEMKLSPGMVVTIEPGIYIAERKLGVRIEDDILITSAGNTNLTAMIPKSIEAVERAMRGR
ncbi:MAG: aminopeptidase P N-terminal domain-containing protein [Phycisphaerales bacterium]